MTSLIELNYKKISELQEAVSEKMTMDFHYFMDYGNELGDRKVLMRAGAQLIIDMLDYNHEFSDIEIMNITEASGRAAEQAVTYCTIKDSADNTVAKGFGSCRLENAFYDLNNAAKSARRNALVDAAVHIKGVSCIFSPDENPILAAYQKNKNQSGEEQKEMPEMSEEEEKEFLSSIAPMAESTEDAEAQTVDATAQNQQSNANTKPAASKPAKAAHSTEAAKQSAIIELHKLAPKSWVLDVPTMFETDSLESMTLDQLEEAVNMIKTSLEAQEKESQSDKNQFENVLV